MLYCISNASYAAEFISCGKLISPDGFLHDRRNIDSYVLIVVCEGTLHIEQNGRKFDVHKNESILLFPFHTHAGYRPSTGKLSYYWVHFYLPDPGRRLCSGHSMLQETAAFTGNLFGTPATTPSNTFLLPEYGKLSQEKRSVLLFVQLLDMAKRDNYQATLRCGYALNLLLLEFTLETFASGNLAKDNYPPQILDIMEWIRTHYDEPITVNDLAAQYHYHPTYLTALFKKYTGYPVSAYINHVRISSAKNILCSTDNLSVQETASMCGFTDEKYFMRLFKKTEGMTPTQYRHAFHEKMINKK